MNSFAEVTVYQALRILRAGSQEGVVGLLLSEDTFESCLRIPVSFPAILFRLSVELQKLHAMEVNNHIQSRIASASAVTTLQPAATANQYAVQKKELYADLAFSRNKLLIDSLDFKAKLGRFSNSDVKQIKRFSAPDDMSFRGLDVNDLKPLQGIHMVKDTQGRYIGRAELDFAMLSYYGYMPPNH